LGLTLIIATHDVDFVPLFADRVYVLNRGKMFLEGLLAEVFSNTETMRSINLRLPRMTHLFEILKRKDGLPISNRFPLTIGEARREILRLLNSRSAIKKEGK
jgi:cobalt/nickel transport system ATP-binding protein